MGGSILLAMLLAVGAPEVQAGDLDGHVTTGTLTAISADKITVQTADGEVGLPRNRLLYVAPQVTPIYTDAAEKPAVWIELVDGSRLNVSSFTVHKEKATIGFGRDEHLELSTGSIRKVRFSDPNSPQSAVWPADVGAQAAADMLSVRTKDGVDFLEGKLGDITDANVEFQIQRETVPAKRSKIDGLIYFHKAGDKLPEATCVIDDANGWCLKAKTVSLLGETLEITTLSGVTVRRPWAAVTRLDFSGGKLVYLSDLPAEKVQWTPFLDFGNAAPALAQFYAPRRDEGREHQPLRVGGKSYAKGLALASRTEIAYRLPAGMKKFRALVGIDDSTREVGQVRLEVSADGKKMFDRTITGKDTPVDLDFDLAGARRLSILVDYGDDSDVGDFLNLADARMLK